MTAASIAVAIWANIKKLGCKMKSETVGFRMQISRDIREFRTRFMLDLSKDSLTMKDYSLHESLRVEELTELATANTREKQLDALIDSIYVTQGQITHCHKHCGFSDGYIDLLISTGMAMGFDMEGAFAEVHASNMSKLCINIKEATETKDDYESCQGYKQVDIIDGGDGFIVRNAIDCRLPCGKEVKAGKTLKSIYYREANLKDFV